MTSLVSRIRGWKAELDDVLEGCVSQPSEVSSPEWYAGLAVSPASFSRQLADMQVSLQRANAPQCTSDQAELIPMPARKIT